VTEYVPDAGDIVWLQVNPFEETAPRREPALVVSPKSYNDRTRLMVACPISAKAKGYPFEVALSTESTVSGVVLSDHVHSIDWVASQASYVAEAPESVLDDCLAKLKALLQL
jgi:mRNA interferase MazF